MNEVKSVKFGKFKLIVFKKGSSFWLKSILVVVLIYILTISVHFLLTYSKEIFIFVNENINLILYFLGISMIASGLYIIVRNI